MQSRAGTDAKEKFVKAVFRYVVTFVFLHSTYLGLKMIICFVQFKICEAYKGSSATVLTRGERLGGVEFRVCDCDDVILCMM